MGNKLVIKDEILGKVTTISSLSYVYSQDTMKMRKYTCDNTYISSFMYSRGFLDACTEIFNRFGTLDNLYVAGPTYGEKCDETIAVKDSQMAVTGKPFRQKKNSPYIDLRIQIGASMEVAEELWCIINPACLIPISLTKCGKKTVHTYIALANDLENFLDYRNDLYVDYTNHSTGKTREDHNNPIHVLVCGTLTQFSTLYECDNISRASTISPKEAESIIGVTLTPINKVVHFSFHVHDFLILFVPFVIASLF